MGYDLKVVLSAAEKKTVAKGIKLNSDQNEQAVQMIRDSADLRQRLRTAAEQAGVGVG